jgi:membrane protein YdbS with pleckstrin-like domain
MKNHQANAEQIKKYTALVKTSKINLFLTPIFLAIFIYFVGVDNISSMSLLPVIFVIMIVMNIGQFFYYRHKLIRLQQSEKPKSDGGIERL